MYVVEDGVEDGGNIPERKWHIIYTYIIPILYIYYTYRYILSDDYMYLMLCCVHFVGGSLTA